jgi:DNA-directed RNA polymerase subunit RPC12/RpoP
MSKEAMREESKRLVEEAMARNVPITRGKTQLEIKCIKCGAPNRVMAEPGQSRVNFTCKDCGHKQTSL